MKKLPPYQVGRRCKAYDGSDSKDYFTVGGVNHTEGVKLVSWDHSMFPVWSSAYALWNTNCKYSSMTFSVGHVDKGNEGSTKLEVYLDGELSQEYDLVWDGPIRSLTVPLNYAANVKLQFAEEDYADFGLFDISFSE